VGNQTQQKIFVMIYTKWSRNLHYMRARPVRSRLCIRTRGKEPTLSDLKNKSAKTATRRSDQKIAEIKKQRREKEEIARDQRYAFLSSSQMGTEGRSERQSHVGGTCLEPVKTTACQRPHTANGICNTARHWGLREGARWVENREWGNAINRRENSTVRMPRWH